MITRHNQIRDLAYNQIWAQMAPLLSDQQWDSLREEVTYRLTGTMLDQLRFRLWEQIRFGSDDRRSGGY